MSLLQDPRTHHFVSRLALGVAGAEVIVLYAPPAAVYLAALVVELPAFARRHLST